ncbi:chain-length determining protein [Pseudomonas chlororaphis]|nr:chain-length determining protein [Pseudomonas chlororaphis]
MQSGHIVNSFDEVDLLELCRGLWQQKWLIFGVTLFSVLASGSYALMASPVYEVRLNALPPSNSDIANFNYGRTKESGLNPFAVKDIYSIFAEKLQSDALRRQFFNDVYLPSLEASQKTLGQDRLYKDFSKDLVVNVAGRDPVDRSYSVVVRNQDPARASEWAGSFIESAGEIAKQEVIDNVTKEAEVLVRNFDQQIVTLRETGQKIRKDRVEHLEEALNVAKSVGLERPLIIATGPSAEVVGRMDGDLAYMRGAKALEAELKNIKNRQSDDAFISGLRDLQSKQDFYKGIETKVINGAVYHLDGEAEKPDSPIAPKKAMILALGLIGGMLIGVGFALFRIFLGKSQSRLRERG